MATISITVMSRCIIERWYLRLRFIGTFEAYNLDPVRSTLFEIRFFSEPYDLPLAVLFFNHALYKELGAR